MMSRSRRLLLRRRRRRRRRRGRRERRPLDRRRIAQRCLPLLLLMRGRRRRCDRGRWRARHCHGHHRHDFAFAFAGRRCCRRRRGCRAGQTGNFRGGRLAFVEEPPTLVAAAPHVRLRVLNVPPGFLPWLPAGLFVRAKNGSVTGAVGRHLFKKKFPPKQATDDPPVLPTLPARIHGRRTDLSQQK